MNMNERIGMVRKHLKLNQSEFSKQLGYSRSIANALESGEKKPSREALIKMVELYNVNINWLFTGKGEMFYNAESEVFTAIEALSILNKLVGLDSEDRNQVVNLIQQLEDKKNNS